MLRRCIPIAANWLSHSVITRSRPEPGAIGSGLPCIQSGTGTPAIWQNVGARSSCPTGSAISLCATLADGAGRQIIGSRISAST